MKMPTPFNANQARPMRAFQIDPSWYEVYWYDVEPPVTPRPTRHHPTALASLAAAIGWLHRIIAEQSVEHTPVAGPQDAR